MQKIRITKEFQFETAHALWNYDGKCKNIHGHTYILFVTVIGEPINDVNSPKNGMVMDFGDLKRIVNREIIEKHDHYVSVNANSPHSDIDFEQFGIELVQRKNYQPTCELMVLEFADIIKRNSPNNVKLYSLKLHETQKSFAEWYASDNE